jgi:hypothetical protein
LVPSPSSHTDDADDDDDVHLSAMTSNEIFRLWTCAAEVSSPKMRKVIMARHSTVSLETWQMNKHLNHSLQDMQPLEGRRPNMLDDSHVDRENGVKKVGY